MEMGDAKDTKKIHPNWNDPEHVARHSCPRENGDMSLSCERKFALHRR